MIDYYGENIDTVAKQVADDDPDVEEHREMIQPLAQRIVELLDELSAVKRTETQLDRRIARAHECLDILDETVDSQELASDLAAVRAALRRSP